MFQNGSFWGHYFFISIPVNSKNKYSDNGDVVTKNNVNVSADSLAVSLLNIKREMIVKVVNIESKKPQPNKK